MILEDAPEQTALAHVWSANYFTQWNEGQRALAEEHLTDIGDNARLFALVALAAGDSQISVYDANYQHNPWRPLTATQEGALPQPPFDGRANESNGACAREGGDKPHSFSPKCLIGTAPLLRS